MIAMSEKLSVNFTLGEYLESPTARANKITEQFSPPLRILNNIRRINKPIQEVRTAFGKPLKFTSAYRCPRLNTAVKGKRASEHLDALGVDISTAGMTESDVIRLIELFISIGVKRIGLGRTFIHVGFSKMSVHPQNVVFNYQGAHATPAYLNKMRNDWILAMKNNKKVAC
jgi:hypothetical protein